MPEENFLLEVDTSRGMGYWIQQNVPYWAEQENLRKIKLTFEQIERLHPEEVFVAIQDNTIVADDLSYSKIREVEQYQRQKYISATRVNDYHQYLMSLSGAGLEKAANEFLLGAPAVRSFFVHRGLNPYIVDDIAANTELLKGLRVAGELVGKGAFVFCAFNTLSSIEDNYNVGNYFNVGVGFGELGLSYYATFMAGSVVGLFIGGAYILVKLNIEALKEDLVDVKKRQELDKIRETGYLPYMLDSSSMSFNQGK